MPVRIGRSVVAAIAIALILAAVAGGSGAAATRPRTDGAQTWRRIARAPIDGRVGAGAVWTGDEMLVWGGVTRADTIAPARDGAAYDPATDSWRRIARAPAGVKGGGGSAAAWTGDAAIFWAGNSPDGPARGVVYDPSTDGWSLLPRGPLGPREGYVSAWTGEELLIVGGTRGDGFASPVAAAVSAEGGWRLLPAVNALEAVIPSGVVWGGNRAFLTGTRYLCPELGSTCTDTERVVTAYDPAADVATSLEPPIASDLRAVGWTGTEVAFVSGAARPRVLLFDPATGSWRAGRRAPCAIDGATGQVAWLGDRLVEACGERRVQVYDADTDTWGVVRAGASPFNRFVWSTIVWTGRRLVVWSGVAPRRSSPTPNVGATITLSG